MTDVDLVATYEVHYVPALEYFTKAIYDVPALALDADGSEQFNPEDGKIKHRFGPLKASFVHETPDQERKRCPAWPLLSVSQASAGT